MQIELNEENVLPTEIVLNAASVLTGESVPVTVTVTVHLAETAPVMETVTVRHVVNVPPTATAMARREEIVHTAPQGTALRMATVETGMRVQNAEDSVVVALAEHRVVNVQAEIVVASPLLVTVMVVQNVPSVLLTVTVHNAGIDLPMVIVDHVLNVQSVLPLVIVHSAEIVPLMATATVRHAVSVPVMVIVGLVQTVGETVLHTGIVVPVRNVPSVLVLEIVHNVENAPRMVTKVHVLSVEEIVLPMEIVLSAHVSEIAAVVLIVLVLRAPVAVILVVVMTVLLVGKSQNLPKSSAWRANFVWFALTTMTPGLMTMSPVMNSTRLPEMS
jgi:hypothetical protein